MNASAELEVMGKRVVLAMSGGVDSSAAAGLLKRQGYEVIGLFMRSGATEETACATDPSGSALPIISAAPHKQGCCSAADAADARRVADELDIPFHALNFSDAFGRIKDYFVDEYLSGRTPNPCVMCNNWLKFGRLWDFAQQVGAEKIATGHYAQVVTGGDGELQLIKGRDGTKDQSYVLFGIARDILQHVLFPVGSSTKIEIRELARDSGIRVADKPDSQEICFIPDNDYAGFIDRYGEKPDTSGELVDTTGNVVGEHDGFEKFTIGQRRGLGVTFGSPRFVTHIDASTRRVVIGEKSDLERSELDANRLNWLVDEPSEPFRCTAKIRYRHPGAAARVTLTDTDQVHVEFDRPQTSVAPGQAVVFYRGDQVLGGGWIQ